MQTVMLSDAVGKGFVFNEAVHDYIYTYIMALPDGMTICSTTMG